jgi:hypothetical protein
VGMEVNFNCCVAEVYGEMQEGENMNWAEN